MTAMRMLLLCFLLSGCVTFDNSHEPSPRTWPQAEEQCRAQPHLDWCHAR